MKDHKDMLEALVSGETLVYNHGDGNRDYRVWMNNGRITFSGFESLTQVFFYHDVLQVETKTININGYEVPAPITEKDIECEDFHDYYIVDLTEEDGVGRYTWDDEETDYRWLAAGLIHLNIEDAKLHAKALLSFSSNV